MEKFCCDNKTDLQDYLIILGDAGINYYMNKRDKKLKNKISNLPITLVCIHGNHEARPQNISSYILTSKAELNCNCWIEPEYPNILFPMDGLMTINDKNFLILGGAYSVDKEYRLKNGWNWFSDEQMSEDERNRILNLIEYLNHYDYILSHTAPISEEPTFLFFNLVTPPRFLFPFFDAFFNRLAFFLIYIIPFFTSTHNKKARLYRTFSTV